MTIELNTELFGFDFRGPASSEALNEYAENVKKDISALIDESYRANYKMLMLTSQTFKQTIALANMINEDGSRDSGSNCKADLTNPENILFEDRDGNPVASTSRLAHRAEVPVIHPQFSSLNWIARDTDQNRVPADNVQTSMESISESGTTYYTPLEYAFSGESDICFERVMKVGSPASPSPEISYFFSVPIIRNGSGYPRSNYIRLYPFPLYTESLRVYYTTDSEPVLTRADSVWNDWPTYLTSLYHNDVYKTRQYGIFTSFPTENITAIRIDIKQPYYLIDGSYYVYSYGLGGVEFGYGKPNATSSTSVVRIEKPTGTFTSVSTDGGNVVFDNVASADYDDVVSTYSWVDESDPSIAYVEITINNSALPDGQIPVITEVSVDYT